MDCITALFFHWLWKGEQRIPLTSKEVKSMGSLGCCFFLTWEESKSTSEKSCLDLAGYHWTQETDNGKGGVGAITVQAGKMELQGKGLGAYFMEWDTCHQELHCVKHLGFWSAMIRTPEELEEERSTQYVTSGYWENQDLQLQLFVVGSCKISYCWINFWPTKKTWSVWCPFGRTLICVTKYFREEMGSN